MISRTPHTRSEEVKLSLVDRFVFIHQINVIIGPWPCFNSNQTSNSVQKEIPLRALISLFRFTATFAPCRLQIVANVPYLMSPSIEVFDVRWGCDGNDISDNSDNTRLAQVR